MKLGLELIDQVLGGCPGRRKNRPERAIGACSVYSRHVALGRRPNAPRFGGEGPILRPLA